MHKNTYSRSSTRLFLLLLSCFSFLFKAQAQWYQVGNAAVLNGGMTIGLGTTTPSATVEFQNNNPGAMGATLRLTGGGSAGAQVALDLATYLASGTLPSARILATDDGDYSGSIAFQTKVPGAMTNSMATRMTIFDNGAVGINTPNAYSYMLAVNGSAIFTQVVVKAIGNWPDFVFHPNYHLLPLDSLSAYVKTNTHLPDLPSADSVEKNGIDLGNTQAAMLKKIEELTLYVLEEHKELEKLKQKNDQLEKLVRRRSHSGSGSAQHPSSHS